MLTEQQIRDMEPGRELDALIALKVMGWGISSTTKYPGKPVLIRSIAPPKDCEGIDLDRYANEEWDLTFLHSEAPNFSTDISAAWEVLERMKEKGAEINVGFYREWDCTLDYPIGCNWREVGKTAPEAICKAALVALRHEFADLRGEDTP